MDTKVLKASDIPYLHHANWTTFEDTVIISETGKRFSFNKCILASISALCKKLFLLLYECPMANLDEVIYISSDYTDAELSILENLLVTGDLPAMLNIPSFDAIDIDLINIEHSFKRSLLIRATDSFPETFKDVVVNIPMLSYDMTPKNGEHINVGGKVEPKFEDETLISSDNLDYLINEDTARADYMMEDQVRVKSEEVDVTTVNRKTKKKRTNNERQLQIAKAVESYKTGKAGSIETVATAHGLAKTTLRTYIMKERNGTFPLKNDVLQPIHDNAIKSESLEYFTKEKFLQDTSGRDIKMESEDIEMEEGNSNFLKSSKTKGRQTSKTKVKKGQNKKRLKKRNRDFKGRFKPESEPGNPDLFFFFPQGQDRDLSKPYQCDLCVRGFDSQKNYRQHCHRHTLETEDRNRAFICDACEAFTCATVKDIQQHRQKDCQIANRTDQNSKFFYWCLVCDPGVKFKLVKDLHYHQQDFHKDVVNLNFPVLTCPTCGSKVAKQVDFEKHMKKEGYYHTFSQCSFCPKRFDSWEQHQEHLTKFHNGVYRYSCGHCGINHFHTYNEFRHHKTTCRLSKATQVLTDYPDGKNVTCTLCHSKLPADQRSVKSHMKESHSGIGIKCKICFDLYFSESALESHVKEVHMKSFSCDKCEKSFSTGSKLRNHQKSHDPEASDNFICPQCGKSFKTKAVMSFHIKRVHEGYRLPSERITNVTRTCDKCGDVVKEHLYKIHVIRYHSNEIHPCSDCGEVFSHKSLLNLHRNKKHVIVTCETCGEQFQNKNKMRHHILQHHTADHEKPFVCPVCKKGFVKKGRLEEHMNIHTGARVQCLFCDKTSTSKTNNSKHMRETHKEQFELYKKTKYRHLRTD